MQGETVSRKPHRPEGLEESQAPFVGAALDLRAILEAYDYRCAFTGTDLRDAGTADPAGALLRLTSLDPRPNELLPATPDAIFAFERGHLAIGPSMNFLVDLARISPELLEQLNPSGRLRLPHTQALYPPSALLKAHREEFAEGLIE